MNLTDLSLYQQAILVLAALVLFSSFAMLAQRRKSALIHIFAWQGGLLALTTALVAYVSGHWHLYLSAGLTFVLKGLGIPYLLRRLAKRLKIYREQDDLGQTAVVMMIGASLVVFSYYVSLPVMQLSTLVTRNTIAVSMAVVLLGMLLMISRRRAIGQVVGFMAMENGLFFAAMVSTYGMPMVVELGIAFDVLVAAVLFGVFFFEIRDTIDSLDIDRLNRLTEVDERVELPE